MARGDKTWSSTPFSPSRDNKVRWHAETKHGHPHPLCHSERIKSGVKQRQNMVICTLFAIKRQSSPMTHRDKHGHTRLLCHPETIKSDVMQRQNNFIHNLFSTRRQSSPMAHERNMVIHTFFAIQRQSSLMARKNKTWSSAPFLLS